MPRSPESADLPIGVSFSQRTVACNTHRRWRFGILPIVHNSNRRPLFRIVLILPAIALLAAIPFFVSNAQAPQQPAPAAQQPGGPVTAPPYPTIPAPPPQRTGLNIVVIDPAHGGTDPGAR